MRRPHWELRLHDAIQAASGRPFSYGAHDCATFAFDVRYELTGEDAAADWRGRYRTELGAARMMRKLGCETLEELATKYLGEPLPTVRLARRGDIVLEGGALGVCIGDRAVFAGGNDLIAKPLHDCEKAWRVE